MTKDTSHDVGLRGVELLSYVLRRIKANKEIWDQRRWAAAFTAHIEEIIEDPDNPACNTAMCIAGHATYAAGYQFDWAGRDTYLLDNDTTLSAIKVKAKALSQPLTVSSVARELLGLTSEESYDLFDSDNRWTDIVRISRQIARDRGTKIQWVD